MQNKPNRSILSDLAFFSQLGFSLVSPPVLCAAGAWWLKKTYALGNWVVVLGILLGVGAAGANLWKFAKYSQQRAKESERDKR